MLEDKAPRDSHIDMDTYVRKISDEIGRLKGLLYIDILVNKGYVNVKRIKDDMVRTPISLFGRTRSKLNEGRKYHSGRISVGVAKALAG